MAIKLKLKALKGIQFEEKIKEQLENQNKQLYINNNLKQNIRNTVAGIQPNSN